MGRRLPSSRPLRLDFLAASTKAVLMELPPCQSNECSRRGCGSTTLLRTTVPWKVCIWDGSFIVARTSVSCAKKVRCALSTALLASITRAIRAFSGKAPQVYLPLVEDEVDCFVFQKQTWRGVILACKSWVDISWRCTRRMKRLVKLLAEPRELRPSRCVDCWIFIVSPVFSVSGVLYIGFVDVRSVSR